MPNIVLDLEAAEREASRRLSRRTDEKSRRDRGITRLDARVVGALRRELSGVEKPSVTAIRRNLLAKCRLWRVRPPSRATIYHFMEREIIHEYEVASLPAHVQQALYNVDLRGRVGGHQLAFYCFNYGNLAVLSFASGLPWVDLEQALRVPGWRPKSRGLVDAVMRERS